MATLFNTDGTMVPVIPVAPPFFALDELKNMLGGWPQILLCPDGDQDNRLVIRQDAKLAGMPLNQGTPTFYDIEIHGHALLCLKSQLEGE